MVDGCVRRIGGVMSAGEKEVQEEKPVPLSLGPPQIPHGLHLGWSLLVRWEAGD